MKHLWLKIIFIALAALFLGGTIGLIVYYYTLTQRTKDTLNQEYKSYFEKARSMKPMTVEDFKKEKPKLYERLMAILLPLGVGMAPKVIESILNRVGGMFVKTGEEAGEQAGKEAIEKLTEKVTEEVGVKMAEAMTEQAAIEGALFDLGPVGWVIDAVMMAGMLMDMASDTDFTRYLDPATIQSIQRAFTSSARKNLRKAYRGANLNLADDDLDVAIVSAPKGAKIPDIGDLMFQQLMNQSINQFRRLGMSDSQRIKDYINPRQMDDKTFRRYAWIIGSVGAALLVLLLVLYWLLASNLPLT